MDFIDRVARPRRRLALFLFVFLVPFGALTSLAIRTLNQDRELATRRQEDERRGMAAAIRQELIGRLENLKLHALSSATDTRREEPSRDPDEAIVLVARYEGSRLVLPWENPAAAADVRRILAGQPFAGLIAGGETQELVHGQPASAVASYQRALSSARHPVQTASAELLIARALGKAERPAEALEYSRRSISRPLSLVDEHGVPFAIYASRRIADLEAVALDDARVALGVARQVGAARWFPPAAVHMAAAVATEINSKGPPEIRSLASTAQLALAGRIARTEQALELQQTFAALARQFPSPSTPGNERFWLPFGQGWLLNLTADIGTRQPLLIAVDAAKAFANLDSTARCVAAGGCRLALAADVGPDDYPLGPALPGLAVLDVTSEAPAESAWLPRQTFYITALSLVLALSALGAYLLWRDVRRELRIADLRSQFVSSVSHELKTPLTAIRMFAETLRLGRPADPARRDEYLDTIVNESERLTRLLNNVLDFTRIESGRKSYQFALHDLQAIARTAVLAMHYPLAQQGFDLAVDLEQSVPPVLSDPDAIEQAILNLLANALKFSGDARKIELRLKRDGAHAVISVRDWGIGIDPVNQRRIFDKFYRVTTAENRLIPGTGLGLTLVDHIVRSHRGFVVVDSAPGSGSTFRIHLPVAGEGPAHADEGVEPTPRRAVESEA